MQQSSKAKRTLLSWSSGKDSAWALHQLQQDPCFELLGLFTTVNEQSQRVAMHAIRQELLFAQATALGLPLEVIPLPFPCTNDDYATIMGDFVKRCKEQEIECIAFGDLYLEDIRDYRIAMLANTGIEPHFPLWNMPTTQLAQEMVESGLKAHISCVDPRQLNVSFIGKDFQQVFSQLPESVDVCGENGEFHTFVYDGPMFAHPIAIDVGEKIQRDGYLYSDIRLRKN